MIKEIGSSFCSNFEDAKDLVIHDSSQIRIPWRFGNKKNTTYYSTCRASIGKILQYESKNNKVALIPSFTCHAVLQPFLANNVEVIPYRIRKDLSVDVTYFESLIKKYHPGFILFHPYFGFSQSEIINVLSSSLEEATIIEDRTQSMFSSFPIAPTSDYVVGSIRKWLEIPDGGFLSADRHIFSRSGHKSEYTNMAIEAMQMKYNYLYFHKQSDYGYREEFAKYEDALDHDNNFYEISDKSIQLLNNYDWKTCFESREYNYKCLLDGLKFINECQPIFDYLPSDTVPFMFPIYVKKGRKDLQKYLADNKIFATVIWACPVEFKDCLTDEEKSIYSEILCFSIDQRYDENDMYRTVKCVTDFFELYY